MPLGDELSGPTSLANPYCQTNCIYEEQILHNTRRETTSLFTCILQRFLLKVTNFLFLGLQNINIFLLLLFGNSVNIQLTFLMHN